MSEKSTIFKHHLSKMCGGGGGAIFEPKTLSMYLKKEKEKKSKKKNDRADSTSAFIPKKSYEFFFNFSPENLLIVLYKLIKVSSLYLKYFPRYHICKIAEYKIQKRAITQKAS